MLKTAHPDAGRFDHLHGDEDDAPELTAAEQAQVDARAGELMRERMDDIAQFDDLLDGIEPTLISHPLHRALRNLDNACSGDRIGINAVLTAIAQIQLTVNNEAERMWRQKCIDQAEGELPKWGIEAALKSTRGRI